jgi:glutamine cyclotransferase
LRRTSVRERGNALLVALIALTGLISLAGITVLSVQGGIATSASDRFNAIALYSAESGAAAGMDYLRKNIVITAGTRTFPSSFVSASNASPPQLPDIPGNNKLPGDPGNLFAPQLQAWYTVEILNNRNDRCPNGTNAYTAGLDCDGDLIIRSTGHGPDGATAQVEWEINGNGAISPTTPCPSYAQKDMAENGAGANDCLSTINATSTATYRPGGP